MAKAKKFGAFGGVFTPSILTILGVIMYLRLPWIVGQAGLFATLGIIIVAHIISASTGLSVASIATDKKVESGGTYYIISRSLGLPIGGTLGWALFVGLSFSVSLYLIGFSEVFLSYFGFDVTLNNIRIAGVIMLVLVTVLTFISTSLAIKTQYFIMTAMVLSLVSVFLGKHSFSPAAIQTDVLPGSLPWIALFAIFFPAVTGFEAGVSMSGDLKDPKKAIPKGTIGAILVGFVTYIGLALYFSYSVDRTMLVNDPNVLFSISWLPQLVVAGILGATFSSALGSILGAPRILQAVAKDRIAPRFFSKGHGPLNEPRNAILLTFVIALGGILIGELNVIARVVTTFFIITYGFLNITYTVESWASSDFRPSFRIPRFVSVVGAIASIVVMIQLDILAMIGATVILLGLFLLLRRQELNLQSGDTWTSVWMSIVKHGLRKLTRNELNNRNWRPNVILMSGGATARPHLIEMGLAMIGHQGVFTNFELEETPDPDSSGSQDERVRVEKLADYPEVITRKYRCSSIYEGIDMISRVYGFSGFEPDTILMGWPRATANPLRMNQLLTALQHRNFNLALLDYKKNVGFGDYLSIDFWWRGSGRELTLALHLMRFISSKKEWRKAKIRVMALNSDTTLTERYYTLLRQMVEHYRLNAEIKVVMHLDHTSALDLIAAESALTSLTFLSLPPTEDETSKQLIERADRLSSKLPTCVWLRASRQFEVVDIIPDSYRQSLPLNQYAARPGMLCDSLDVSAADRDAQELMDFAAQEERDLVRLEEEMIVVLKHRRDAVIEALAQQKDDAEQWLQLIKNQVKEELEFEKSLLQKTLLSFLAEVSKNVHSLLNQLHLKPGRKDAKAMEVAVMYYLYARRVDSVERFYTELLLRSVHYTISIRELFVEIHSAATSDIHTKKSVELLDQIRLQNNTHFNEMFSHLVNDLRQDILLLSQMMEGPKLNEMRSGLKKLIQQKGAKLVALEDAPARLHHFLQLQWNKILLDVLCVGAHKQLEVRSQVLFAELHQSLKNSLYAYLDHMRADLNSAEGPKLELLPEGSSLPLLESYFNRMNIDVRELLNEIPELLSVVGNQIPEDLSIATIEDLPHYEINVRTTIDYYVSNEYVDQLNKQSEAFSKGIQRVGVALSNIARLAGYHRSQQQSSADRRIFEDLKQHVDKEMVRLQKLESDMHQQLETSLQKAFSPLNAAQIVNAAGMPGARLMQRQQQHRVHRKFSNWLQARMEQVQEVLVAMFYHQSKGVLWTKRQELLSEREALYPGDVLKQYAETHVPNPSVIAKLPYYYVNLFTDEAGATKEFRIAMKEEMAQGDKAIDRFNNGKAGLVVVTGDRGSGKSSLSRYLVEKHFEKSDVWRIIAPLECTADLSSFESQLKEFAGGKGSLDRRLDVLKGKRVVVIDDLEAWWERRPGGARVVERMLELVRLYGTQLLFVVTINRHALRILEQLTQINSWVNELIYCQPFDAQELKEMVLTRHQAGGLSFVLDSSEEETMSNWSFAQLFNHLFNCSGGNPGIAVQLWLSGIHDVDGSRISIAKVPPQELNVEGYLSENELLVLLLFVLHRRFSVERLARVLQWNVDAVAVIVRQLHRTGVLRESSAGIFLLQPSLEATLVTNLKKMAIL
jgi:amino acid transporter